MASMRTSTKEAGGDGGEAIIMAAGGESATMEAKLLDGAEKKDKVKRSRKGRRPKNRTASMDMGSCDDDISISILSGEGKIESANDTCEIHHDASNISFNDLFADLRNFKEDNNSLTISISHPTFISIMDNLSAVGMEELLKRRWEDQFNSLKTFTKKHGDCNVPLDHPTLGEWVRIQRGHYELYKMRLPTPLTKKRFTKLEEILGFDEYIKSKKEDADKNLTMDERTSLKTATNKVRLMGRTNRAFHASVPAKKKLPDKEKVAAEIKKKREAGNFHKTAAHRSLLLEEVFASIEEDEKLNSSTADNNDAGGENEKKKRQEETEQCKIFSSPMPAISTSDVSAKEHLEKQDSLTTVNVYEEKLEKLRRKLLAETNRTCYAPTTEEYDAVVEEESGSSFKNKISTNSKVAANKVKAMRKAAKAFPSLKKKSPDNEVAVASKIQNKRGEVNIHQPTVHSSLLLKDVSTSSPGAEKEEATLGSAMPVISMSASNKKDNERSDSTLDTYEEKMEKLVRRKLSGEENRRIYKPASKSSADDVRKDTKGSVDSDVGAHKKKNYRRRATDDYLSAPTPPEALNRLNRKNKPYRRRATDNYLSAPSPPEAPSGSSTFEDRLNHKLQTYEEQNKNDPKTPGDSCIFEERLVRKAKGDNLEKIYKDRNKDVDSTLRTHLSTAMPPEAPSGYPTVENRLHHKPEEDSAEAINENGPEGDNGESTERESFSIEEILGASVLLADDDFGASRRDSSFWKDKLKASGWRSKDGLDVATPLQGERFSRWMLLFDETKYGDKEAQSDCVSSVLNSIIYSDKWDFIPEENGNVALEMTTQSLDEHQKVELNVKKLDNLYTRSDVYYY